MYVCVCIGMGVGVYVCGCSCLLLCLRVCVCCPLFGARRALLAEVVVFPIHLDLNALCLKGRRTIV